MLVVTKEDSEGRLLVVPIDGLNFADEEGLVMQIEDQRPAQWSQRVLADFVKPVITKVFADGTQVAEITSQDKALEA
jgi:hypothetical protein